MSQFASSIVFIDAKVSNAQNLVDSVLPGTDVQVIDADRDGIKQISDFLNAHPRNQVHIVAHGAPGCLYLGNTQLSLDTLKDYANELQAWFSPSTAATSVLRLYGCNVAIGDAGAEFLTKLQNLVGANIGASTTPIGHADLGGNWDLDFTLGEVTSNLPFAPEEITTYEGILGIYTVTEDNERQARDNTPDEDFNVLIGKADPLAPVEFDIFTNEDAVTNAFLLLTVADVDFAEGERDQVSINDNVLGFLEGQNNLPYKTIFRIPDLSWVNNGENYIQIDIDLTDGNPPWRIVMERADLLVNYDGSSLGSAFLRTGVTDSTVYQPGDPVTLTLEIDTTLNSQTLRVESVLRNPAGQAVAFDISPLATNFQINGTADEPFNWMPQLPANATPGQWSIDTAVFDTNTQNFQFLNTETFSVGNVALVDPHTNFNQDAFGDMVFRNPVTGTNEVQLLNGQGNILSTVPILLDPGSPEWNIEGIGDFDGDGIEDDLFWQGADNSRLAIWLTDQTPGGAQIVGGNANFQLPTLPPGVNASDLVFGGVGSFDGDGLQDDLVWYDPANYDIVVVYTNNGVATSSALVNQKPFGEGWQIVGVGNFSNQSTTEQDDLLWRNPLSGLNIIWEMNGTTATGSKFTTPVAGDSWKVKGVTDLDGDFIANDILWQNSASGAINFWFTDAGALVDGVNNVTTIADPGYMVV
jgi:hypothetical protein